MTAGIRYSLKKHSGLIYSLQGVHLNQNSVKLHLSETFLFVAVTNSSSVQSSFLSLFHHEVLCDSAGWNLKTVRFAFNLAKVRGVRSVYFVPG